MSCDHAWSRAIRGRRTGLFIRTCSLCGESSHTTTAPDESPIVTRVDANVEAPEYLDIRGRMERINVKQFGSKVWRDVRAKQAGDQE